MIVKKFRTGAHLVAGFMQEGIWFVQDAYLTKGLRHIDSKESAMRYFYTTAYARELKSDRPDLYLRLHRLTNPRLYMLIKGIEPDSEEAVKIMAEYIKFKMLQK